MKFYIRYVLLLTCLFFFPFHQGVTDAQVAEPEIYFCVAPEGADESPYLIEFWDSTVFGILIPENAEVSIFSNTFYTGILYTVNTSARSGGYLTLEELATVNTYTAVAAENPCLNPNTADLFARLPFRSIPLPMSIHHAVVVQEGRNTELGNPFQRVVSFSFGIGGEGDLRNLQIIQNSELDPFLNFRFFDLEQNTPFMVIANKDFGIGQSLPDTNPPEFSRERPSDIRSFVKSDLEDLYGLDIFAVADEANARIYISSGLLDMYRGNYIRISLAPDTVERFPAFDPGTFLRALPDADAAFVSPDQIEDDPLRLNLPFEENPRGQVSGESVYEVIEIEENTGQLLIDYNGSPAYVESWLVEGILNE